MFCACVSSVLCTFFSKNFRESRPRHSSHSHDLGRDEVEDEHHDEAQGAVEDGAVEEVLAEAVALFQLVCAVLDAVRQDGQDVDDLEDVHADHELEVVRGDAVAEQARVIADVAAELGRGAERPDVSRERAQDRGDHGRDGDDDRGDGRRQENDL